jgi:UPF0271 protein
MRRRVLLNIDLGELPEEPDELYECAHIANIACGGHAGDDDSMKRAVERCRAAGTRIGAHPSYPDREAFGRRAVAIAPEALRASVAAQCARLARISAALEGKVAFVKPHGALYHAAADRSELADAVVRGAVEGLGPGVAVVGPGRGELAQAAARAGLAYVREGFADRATRANGSLVSRDEPGAVLAEPGACAARARALALQGDIETVCVHGDTPGAAAVARAVRAALDLLGEGSA